MNWFVDILRRYRGTGRVPGRGASGAVIGKIEAGQRGPRDGDRQLCSRDCWSGS